MYDEFYLSTAHTNIHTELSVQAQRPTRLVVSNVYAYNNIYNTYKFKSSGTRPARRARGR